MAMRISVWSRRAGPEDVDAAAAAVLWALP
jgi:hypothetical protein